MSYIDPEEGVGTRWPLWRPLLGVAIAALLILLVIAGSTPPPSLAGALGFATGAMIVFYPILYFAALRRTSVGWMVGAFLGIGALTVVATLGRTGQQAEQLRGDMSRVRDDMGAVLKGKTLAPAGEAEGVSGVTRNFLAQLQKDQEAYLAEAKATGVEMLVVPEQLQRSPDVLKNCDRIAALDGTVTRYRALWHQRIAEARTALQKVDMHPGLRAETLRGFDQGERRNRPETERRWQLEAMRVKELAQMCAVLAARRWRLENGSYAFTSASDLAKFNAAAQRHDRMLTEQQALEVQARNRSQASYNDLNRQLR